LAIRGSIRIFASGAAAIGNRLIAAIIAERERQANLSVLRALSDRELRDVGLVRSQIGAGLAQAAKDRSCAQNPRRAGRDRPLPEGLGQDRTSESNPELTNGRQGLGRHPQGSAAGGLNTKMQSNDTRQDSLFPAA
jgi:uncharacterized protein YjiS (DUF1127 family)